MLPNAVTHGLPPRLRSGPACHDCRDVAPSALYLIAAFAKCSFTEMTTCSMGRELCLSPPSFEEHGAA
jgi:hypothetical protein